MVLVFCCVLPFLPVFPQTWPDPREHGVGLFSSTPPVPSHIKWRPRQDPSWVYLRGLLSKSPGARPCCLSPEARYFSSLLIVVFRLAALTVEVAIRANCPFCGRPRQLWSFVPLYICLFGRPRQLCPFVYMVFNSMWFIYWFLVSIFGSLFQFTLFLSRYYFSGYFLFSFFLWLVWFCWLFTSTSCLWLHWTSWRNKPFP